MWCCACATVRDHLNCFLPEAEKAPVNATETEILKQLLGRVSKRRHGVKSIVHQLLPNTCCLFRAQTLRLLVTTRYCH